MKWIWFGLAVIVGAGLSFVLLRGFIGEDNWICSNGTWVKHGKPSAQKPTNPCPGLKIRASSMKITSSAFTDSQIIPRQYACLGQGINPPLAISGVPSGVNSLALILDDPDAQGGTFYHWIIWNILPQTREIPEGVTLPAFIEGTNSAGKVGYSPPCPPKETHRYVFTLYALDITPSLPTTATASDLKKALENHILSEATLTGTYNQ